MKIDPSKSVLHVAHEQRLKVVQPAPADGLLTTSYLVEVQGVSFDHALLCGKKGCGRVLLPHFSREEAHEFFVREIGRTLAECPDCLSANLLSTKLKKPHEV